MYQTYSMHDYSRDIMLATAQENIELRMLLSAAGNKKLEIEESMKKLEEVSKKTGEILSQMLPKSVAERLRLYFYTSHILQKHDNNKRPVHLPQYLLYFVINRKGEHPMDTCEVFPSATMLFSDIVDFDTICSKLKPPQVFELLNSVYTLFDFLVDQNGVYKIFNTKFKRDTQTIGKIIETVNDTFDVIICCTRTY